MKFTRLLFFIVVLFFTGVIDSGACTTAIISGKFTEDGRPLLLKHRDSGFLQNKMMYFEDGKYKYIGLINTPDKEGNEVWAGVNESGFAIMNSASYNLNGNDGVKIKDREGIVMKLALQKCKTLADFEQLLDTLQKPMGVEANFGVIDAFGGAAYYETSNFDYKKIDVNDPSVAPFGYVIRTNYSFTGRPDAGYGYIRYRTADKLFYDAESSGDLTFSFILKNVSRSLKHSLTGADLAENTAENETDSRFVHFEDYIPRYSSCSDVVIHGVKENEDPAFATMWTILGFPLTSVALPAWVKGGNSMPGILMEGDLGVAPLCDASLKLKDECFPTKRGSGKNYMNTAPLVNNAGTGIMQKLEPVEDEIVKRTGNKMETWRENGFTYQEIAGYNDELNRLIKEKYMELFGIEL